MKIPYVDIKGQHEALLKPLVRAATKVLKSGAFILGDEVAALEERFKNYVGVPHAVAVNSGTDALMLALKALGIGTGDEVITVPNSFLASASAIVAVGARPVFVDVGEDQNMDPSLLSAAITDRTRAIMPVHLGGKLAPMKAIMRVAGAHKLYVVEDAAQAIGTEYRGKRAGSFGDINCFSLHPLKTLNACGDGGMLTVKSAKHAQALRELRNIGLKNRNEADRWGYNSRLDSLQAAFVSVKFPYIDRWIARRRTTAAYYQKHLEGLVTCPTEEKDERHAYHLFVIQTPRRDELAAHLTKHGVETKIHYPLPIHLQKCAESLGYKRGDFPVAERQAGQIISIPIHQGLTREDTTYVVDCIRSFFN